MAILSWVAVESSAQTIMVPHTRVINTPYGKVNQTTWINTGQPYYYFGQKNAIVFPLNYKGNFTVVTASDSVFTDKVNLILDDSINTAVVERRSKKGGDIVFKPAETKQLQQVFNGKMYTGIPADTCWLFKVIPGNINSYAPFPTDSGDFVIAVQKGDGPIVPMTKENLYEMIDDPKLRKAIDKGKLYHAVWKYNGSK